MKPGDLVRFLDTPMIEPIYHGRIGIVIEISQNAKGYPFPPSGLVMVDHNVLEYCSLGREIELIDEAR